MKLQNKLQHKTEENKMTRFQQEISGMLGEFWVKNAKKELEQIQSEFNQGKIKVDENGVLRNCIGRVAVEEVCEKCQYLGIVFDRTKTQVERYREDRKAMEKYKSQQREPNEEQLAEMRAVFGKGAVIVDVITGKEIKL